MNDLDKLFLLHRKMPNVVETFTFNSKDISILKNEALIILDTNVLLLPYKAGKTSFDAIINVYNKLKNENRLFLPEQVAREFIKNKPEKIGELYKALNDKISKITVISDFDYPILSDLQEYQNIQNKLKDLDELKKEISKLNKSILGQITEWGWNDPVSKKYRQVFTEETFILLDQDISDEKTLMDTLNDRNGLKLPPGYKDEGKEENSIGDYLIWLAIIQIAKAKDKDVIFISGDEKSDWQHRSNETALFPRFELVEEFRKKTDGKTINIMPLSKFMELLEQDESVVEDIKKEEERYIENLDKNFIFQHECPHCKNNIEKELKNDFSKSIVVSCYSCEGKYHIFKDFQGQIGVKIFESRKIDHIVMDQIEEVDCPDCGFNNTIVLKTRHNSTVHNICQECDIKFSSHRLKDMSVKTVKCE
ncbi:PIN domain-containing protein [Acinetobacter pittii]|uniref:PIN domain-containing protein n=1 Tax=Acinetobacter pittii TaxID=48296 RepID=UPI0009942706|nr:PIN domain-containing protein [Acinetobacter pittii]OOT50870.1 hypothetical protein BTG92_12020 [Acinetobacter pittii]OTU68948.1 hypothetical protein CAT31_04030 [Acinetobacter pittii]